MCTIHTYSARFYRKNQALIQGQIRQDAIMNDDGLSLLFLDGHNEKANTVYRTMDPENFLAILAFLMKDATKHARVFIHLRAATTSYVGVGYTHAFDDMNGIFYMHNGILSNPKHHSVDSFQMVNWKDNEGDGLMQNLLNRKEHFANIFRIDTNTYKWTMVRMSSGSLHTDGNGNYSSKKFGNIDREVPNNSTLTFSMNRIEKPRWSGNYYDRRGVKSSYWSSSPDSDDWMDGDNFGEYRNKWKPATSTTLTAEDDSGKSLPKGASYSNWRPGTRWDNDSQRYIPKPDWDEKHPKYASGSLLRGDTHREPNSNTKGDTERLPKDSARTTETAEVLKAAQEAATKAAINATVTTPEGKTMPPFTGTSIKPAYPLPRADVVVPNTELNKDTPPAEDTSYDEIALNEWLRKNRRGA